MRYRVQYREHRQQIVFLEMEILTEDLRTDKNKNSMLNTQTKPIPLVFFSDFIYLTVILKYLQCYFLGS